jgi:metabolite-proton symporter
MASQPRELRRVIAASMIGTTIEWYDFFLYGAAAALVFNKLFFPNSDPLTGTLLAFATYAIGFVARPLGGLVFGHYGDRIGRKRLLMLSLMLMGGATVLIGCLPSYSQIGVAAPLLLVVLRLAQGFAVGGEWGGAVLMAAEHGDSARRGFWTSWPQSGVAFGNLGASGLLALLATTQNDADFLAWGWRIPFLLSAVLIGVGWWVRSRVEESPLFVAARREAAAIERAPILEVFRRRPRRLLIGMGLKFGENLSYYVITVFSITYVTQVVGLTRQMALNAVLIASAFHAVAIIGSGALSDRVGRRVVYAVGAGGMAAWAFAFFPLLDHASLGSITLAATVGLIFHGMMGGPQAAFLAEMFPTRIRYSGVSLAYQLTSIAAGSLAPIIALAILKSTGSALGVSVYVGLAALVSFVAALAARETRGKSFAEIDAEA